jgi:fatty acid desaturase
MRIAVWFVGGMLLALGARSTAALLLEHQSLAWLTWAMAGTVFVAIELVAHGVLHLRGRPSFYNGLG